jgi:diacylglycerol kinase family enzyme
MAKILRKKAHLSKHIETYVTDKIKIIRDQKDTIHFDGDPEFTEKEVDFVNNKHTLRVIIGEAYKG